MVIRLTLQKAIRIAGKKVVVQGMRGYRTYSIPIRSNIHIPSPEEGLYNVWVEWDDNNTYLEPPVAVEFTEQVRKPITDSLYDKLAYRENLLLQKKEEEELSGVY